MGLARTYQRAENYLAVRHLFGKPKTDEQKKLFKQLRVFHWARSYARLVDDAYEKAVEEREKASRKGNLRSMVEASAYTDKRHTAKMMMDGKLMQEADRVAAFGQPLLAEAAASLYQKEEKIRKLEAVFSPPRDTIFDTCAIAGGAIGGWLLSGEDFISPAGALGVFFGALGGLVLSAAPQMALSTLSIAAAHFKGLFDYVLKLPKDLI